MNALTGHVRRCIEDYRMIEKGDCVAVGVSGGKDSLALLCCLAELREYLPETFTLKAITLDMGMGMDFSPIEKLCGELSVPYIIKETRLKQVIFDERKETNPCALCAKMRRGILHRTMKEVGANKIALGHHFDDAVETMLLSLFYEGRISCFQPVTYLSRSDVTQIRPLLYCEEKQIISFAKNVSLPVVENLCPQDGESKRQEIKELVAFLAEKYPDIKAKVFGAMQRYPLPGWETNEL